MAASLEIKMVNRIKTYEKNLRCEKVIIIKRCSIVCTFGGLVFFVIAPQGKALDNGKSPYACQRDNASYRFMFFLELEILCICDHLWCVAFLMNS